MELAMRSAGHLRRVPVMPCGAQDAFGESRYGHALCRTFSGKKDEAMRSAGRFPVRKIEPCALQGNYSIYRTHGLI